MMPIFPPRLKGRHGIAAEPESKISIRLLQARWRIRTSKKGAVQSRTASTITCAIAVRCASLLWFARTSITDSSMAP